MRIMSAAESRLVLVRRLGNVADVTHMPRFKNRMSNLLRDSGEQQCGSHSHQIINEANLIGGENVGGITIGGAEAPAAPADAASDDGDGDGESDPDRRPPNHHSTTQHHHLIQAVSTVPCGGAK